MSIEYRDKLRSLNFVATRVPSKVTYDHTDTGVVRTTEKDESQDINIQLDKPVAPHWKEEV